VPIVKKDSGIDLGGDKLAMQRLREAAEKAKRELDGLDQADVSLPFITADKTGPKHMNVEISRAKFEALVQPLVDRTIDPCKVRIIDFLMLIQSDYALVWRRQFRCLMPRLRSMNRNA